MSIIIDQKIARAMLRLASSVPLAFDTGFMERVPLVRAMAEQGYLWNLSHNGNSVSKVHSCNILSRWGRLYADKPKLNEDWLVSNFPLEMLLTEALSIKDTYPNLEVFSCIFGRKKLVDCVDAEFTQHTIFRTEAQSIRAAEANMHRKEIEVILTH